MQKNMHPSSFYGKAESTEAKQKVWDSVHIKNHINRLQGKPSHSMPGDRPGRRRAAPFNKEANKRLEKAHQDLLKGMRDKAEKMHNGGGGGGREKKQGQGKSAEKVPARRSRRGGRAKKTVSYKGQL